MSNQLEKLQECISELEESAAKKDQQISQLTSRMREYEMGEYGLAEAVSEIKECKKIIRARDWEVERLTDEINVLKLQISEIKSGEDDRKPLAVNESLVQEMPSTDKKKGEERVLGFSKRSQCYLPMQSSKYIEEMCATQVQNEKLRMQLSKVCEDAMEASVHLQKLNRYERSKHEEIIKKLRETIQELNVTSKDNESAIVNRNVKTIQEPTDIPEASLRRISNEDIEVQEMFHRLSNQIKILKNNQNILIRRYIIISDKEEYLRKENVKLRKAINFYWKRHSHDCSAVKLEMNKDMSSKHLSSEDILFLEELAGKSNNTCHNSACHTSISKLTGLVTKLLEEISVVQQLLEIAHYQTQAAEAVCFAQEVEFKALQDQISLLQAQSDEKMLLGKLAMKVLQLQFSQAACVYELKKYKTDKQTLQDWCSILKKEYEENGRRFAGMYLDAQDKVKHLREVLKDLCQRCNTALSSYLSPEIK